MLRRRLCSLEVAQCKTSANQFKIVVMIHLNVPFLEKDQVKVLGARWDPVKKAWYVPAGVEVKLFARWLPGDFQFDEDGMEHEASEHKDNLCSLANYLGQISLIVNEACILPVWVVAEISELRIHNGISYISLVEHDARGTLIARSNARVWQNKYQHIFSKFKTSTGVELSAGIKVLVQLTANFHQSHGFAVIVEDIDPSYTIGDMAAKIAQIREQLQSEKIYDLNKSLTKPLDFCKVAVISPQAAAGLGDFKREAELLAKYDLCVFDYYHAIFQGVSAAASIAEQLDTITSSAIEYDAIVIIRGGGAISDLAWLNDLILARKVCMCRLPVMVGIGHERDFTILDEIACEKFDTPSKVAARIFTTITNNALIGEQAFNEILQKSKQQVLHTEFMSLETYNKIRQNVANTLALYAEKTHNSYQLVQNASLTVLARQMSKVDEFLQQILLLSDSQLKQANISLNALMSMILVQDPQNILKRGYVLVKNNNEIITSKMQAVQHNKLMLVFKDGDLNVKVE
jgi:exodeoxyribonuclease VII large subunit